MGQPGRELVEDYLRLGLALGRHVDGMVDSYYGPPALAEAAAAGAPVDPRELAERARRLLGELDSDRSLDPRRRAWLWAQTRGLYTSARKLAGEPIGYLDEIESCYGVRPRLVEEDEMADAHRKLDAVIPGSGQLAERYQMWREAQAVPTDRLLPAVSALAEDFRERTQTAFGLPDGERVDFNLVDSKPWSGFNYYLGGLHSRVVINTDLPVLSLSLGHLVAHESYPGHHTEHCRKEAGLVRRERYLEETLFLVGTPQCVLAEGLADLGLEVICGPRPETAVAEQMRAEGVPYQAEVAAEAAPAVETLGAVRGNAAILVHDRGLPASEAIDYISRWALCGPVRAAKAVEFVMDPTWRAYPFCYIEGVRLCREYVAGDPRRFERLITEQMVPSELVASATGP